MRPIPSFISTLESIFQRTSAAMQASHQQAEELSADLRGLTGAKHDGLRWSPVSLMRALEDEAKHFAALIVSFASQMLSTPDAPLEIDMGEFIRPYALAERRIRDRLRDYDDGLSWNEAEPRIIAIWRSFSPLKVWRRLDRAYPPERAVALAAERGARTIVSTFNLRASRPMQEVKGRIELSATVYSRSHRGAYQLTGGDVARLGTALEGIGIALAQAGEDDAAASLCQGKTSLRSMERGYSSRAKYEMGAGITLVAFKDQVKLSLPADLAARINTFVSLHASGELQRTSRF